MSTFTFTALLEEDLLQGVNGSSIGYGDTFVMPDGATVEMIVTDDDNRMSGDYYSNEHGDDYSGQTADININGELLFDDVKIYAESYHVLQGSDGNYYYMIEIELANGDAPGEGDDFFSFWGQVPPAGVSLQVLGTYNVTCDWIDYDCLDGGELITLEPENTAPVAVNDTLETNELTAVSANLLDNDSDDDGDPITVTAIEDGEIGTAFQVTTAKGNTGMVTVQADGSFTFDPLDGFLGLAQDEQDSFELTYTISDDPQANVKHNLMFVLDISNSTVGTSGNNAFDGTGAGDVNNDGVADTVLDAEIAAVLAAVNNLIAQGVDASNIDIGIATFSGVAAGFATVDAETLGTFALDDGNLMDTLMGIQSGGWTNYEAGLQQAESWFAGQAGDGAQNKLIFLSDGRPISGYDYSAGQYITQTEADYGDEVSRIANDYGAEIYGIGVGANSDLDYLNDLDNTGGAERVLDASTLNVVVSNAVAQPASATATVTVTINGLNDGPDAVNDVLTVDEGVEGVVHLLSNDTDPENDVLTLTEVEGFTVGTPFVVTTAKGNTGSVTVDATGKLTFVPGQGFDDLNDSETDSFVLTYKITDGQFDDTATVTVTVNGTGQPVDAMDDAYTINEDQGVSENLLTNDIPNDGSLKVVGVSDGGATASAAAAAVSDVPVVGEAFTVMTDGGREGTVTLEEDGTFTFDGGENFIELAQGDTDSFDLNYTVARVGETTSRTIDFENLVAGTIVGAQIDGVTVSAQRNGDGAASLNDAMIFDADNPSGGDGDLGVAGLGNILIISEDGDSSDPDDNAGGGTFVFDFEAPTQIDSLTFVDIDHGETPPRISLFNAAGGLITVVDGAMTGDREKGEVLIDVADVSRMEVKLVGSGGIDDLKITETNSVGSSSDTATVTVTINGQNEAPLPVNDLILTVEGTSGEVNILANDTDPDGDTLTLLEAGNVPIGQEFTVFTSNQRSGTVTVDALGKATFVPDETFDDLDQDEVDMVSFTYLVSDGQFTRQATVNIEVSGLNLAPTPAEDTLTTEEGVAQTINILGNDTDPDGDSLAIVNVNGVPVGEEFEVATAEGYKGTVKVLSNGDLTFTPSSDFDVLNDGQSAMVSFDYTVSDGQFESDATVTVLVNGVSPANGKVTVSGTISAQASGSTHVAVVLDTSVITHVFADAKTTVDYDSDSKVGTISDLMLQKVLDLALTLDDSDTISVITSDVEYDFSTGQPKPRSEQDAPVIINGTAAVFKEAANDPAKAKELFAAIESTYKIGDFVVDLPEGLSAAAQSFEDAGSDNNEVIVITSTDTIDQDGSVMARQDLVDNYSADINVLYIEAGAFADTSNLNAIDTEDGVSMTETTALASLVDEAPTTLATVEAFSILLDGAKVAGIDAGDLVANEADGTYTFTATEIELDGMSGELEIKALIDTDNKADTPAEEFVYLGNANTDLGVMDGDTIDFILG